jgi:hypothetical protein
LLKERNVSMYHPRILSPPLINPKFFSPNHGVIIGNRKKFENKIEWVISLGWLGEKASEMKEKIGKGK